MANIVIRDLEMDKELDNVSLAEIIGGYRCNPKKRVCVRRRVRYLKRITYHARVVRVSYMKRTRYVAAYKTIRICFWK